jgi:hypothetical protein
MVASTSLSIRTPTSTSGTVRIVALQTVDVAVRHAVSFAFNNDGA